MTDIFLSFVITTYNRVSVISIAIDSVLKQIQSSTKRHEIVIIDDASCDGTEVFLKMYYQKQIDNQLIRLKCLTKNVGVTGAKNSGYEEATGRWIIFLDSDDYLVPGVLPKMEEVFLNNVLSPIVFFRCVNTLDQFVGQKFDVEKKINIVEYLNETSYGEALTAINKQLVCIESPYPAELRGFEGLGCSRIIFRHGPAVLSSVIARVYVQNGNDRLSIGKGFCRRLLLLAKGNMIMLREFYKVMSWKLKVKYIVKAGVYEILGFSYKIFGAAK